MPPKKGQQKQAGSYKIGTQIKDVIPTSEKNQPRTNRPNKQIEASTEVIRENQYESFQSIEEWPGDEQAQLFDFGLHGTTVFSEQQQILKQYFEIKNQKDKVVFWRRPQDFVKLEQEEKASEREMMQYRRRQSFTSNIASNFQNDEQKIIDDNLIYQKNKVDLTSQEEQQELEQQQQQQQQNQNKGKGKQQNNQETQQQLQQGGKKQINLTVFESFEREETNEEMEARIKLQEQKAQDTKKGAKKAPKKGEEQLEGPKTIKDIKISNMDMSINLLEDFKWIASQFQLIKDRNLNDCKSGRPIWSKIYPQQDGVPVFNPSGRYWVNLYYMGKERKIEIDDKMPVDYTGKCYLPRSIKKEEIWAYLLSKALLKLILQTQNIDEQYSLTGSGFINYALTGMLSETIPINSNDEQLTQNSIHFINKLLKDKHFIENDAFVTCYCEPSYKPSAESNIKKEVKDYYIDRVREVENIVEERSEENDSDAEADQSFDNNNNQQQQLNSQQQLQEERTSPMKKKTSNKYIPETYDSPSKIKKVFKNKNNIETLSQKPTYVIPGFSYPIIESFRNENFNMVYVQKRSEREIKLRQEYHEISKVSMHKFTKDEKLEHRRRKKELKEKITECDRARVELITKPPIQYQLFRVKTNARRCPLLNIVCPFNNDEINIAKTCLQNNLSKPPNYELPEIRDDGKSMISTAKQQDDSFIMKPLDDFSSVAHLKTPMSRGLGGNWVKFSDLKGCFQYFQIFYNPNKLNYNNDIFVQHNPDFELTMNDKNEILLISKKEKQNQQQKATDQEENDESLQHISSQLHDSQQLQENEQQQETIRFLFGFQHENAKNKQIIPSPYCILQKFDFSLFDSVHDYPPLRLKQQSQMLQLENQNQVFKVMACSPLSYMLNISCDSQVESMSICDYLINYENWTAKQIKVDYMPVEKETYHNLVRFKIQPFENENTFILKLNSTDNNMLKYFRYKILEQPSDDCSSYMLENNEGVTKNIYESNYEMQSYLRVTLKANTAYHLLIEGMVPYNLGSGTLDCDFYLKEAEQQIEQVDLVEPVEYFDKYTPYKYGILFREKLYSSENTVSSVFLRLGKVEEGQQQQQEKDKKGAKKGAVGNGSDIQEQPLEKQRKIILELYENDKLIQYTSGYNQAYLSFILLQANNQAEGKNYYLQAKFDLREWDGCKIASPETEGIHWFLKVQSSDTIGIVKDTAKEDREKAVAKSWEDGEPGRAAKAVNARKKLFLLKKQKQGEQLTEEELELLNEPRLTKKQREEETQAGGKGKKAPPKKDDKKQAKKGGKQQKESQVYDKEIPIEKKYPLSKDHRMNEIRAFLKHMEEERVQEVLAAHQGLINVRSEENKQEIARKAEISVERLEQILSSSKELREQLSLLQNDQKAKIIKQFGEKSQITKEQWEQYQQKREEIKNSLSTKNTKEKELVDICQSENPTISLESLEKLIEEAKAVPEMNQNLIELSYRVLKNLKINALKEKFNNALGTFDVETLKNCLQEFNDFSVTGIESDIIEKSEAMIQEASENPNFQAEKAAELKKAGKKGKK